MMLMMTLTALVLGRLVSLLLDDSALVGFDLASLIYRVLAAVLAGVAWQVIRERPEAEPERIEPATAGWSANRRNRFSSVTARRRSNLPSVKSRRSRFGAAVPMTEPVQAAASR